jgi:biotin carboxyl carrier protein
MRFRLVVDGESRQIEVDPGPNGLVVRVDGAEYLAEATSSPPEFLIRIGRGSHRIRFQGQTVLVDDERHEISIPDVEGAATAQAPEGSVQGATILEVRPPMPGRVIRILAPVGTRVVRGQILLVLEAMKMQNEIPAPRDGIVREVPVAEGESITGDRVVAVLEMS